ncbi:heavy metal-responsive transcriptional regulator [Rhodococcus sp. NPDC056960]|uniref:heavy metal-responsive transcriptional regulator n=1 Tax=Rhodococcus sp. NPDC056960 TaxID=3345982 RepID=UPI00362B554C
MVRVVRGALIAVMQGLPRQLARSVTWDQGTKLARHHEFTAATGLLEVWGQGVCAELRQRMLPLVTDRITDADNQIAELTAFSAHLAGVRADLAEPAPSGACRPDCGCVTGPSSAPIPLTLERLRPEPSPARELWQDAPVACTLGGDEYSERAQQWQQVLDSATGREEIGGGIRVTLPADPDLVADVARLAVAEQGCCAFFGFTMHLSPDELELTVRAPETAEALLTELFGAKV